MDMPEILYKYRPCDKYNEDILAAHEMFFPRPTAFNDPFDCRIPIVFDGSVNEWRNFLRTELKKTHPEWSDDDLESEVNAMIRNGVIEQMGRRDFAEDLAKKELDKMEILCLSEPNDNILMWSHYADSHRGVCLGFATRE